MKILRAYFITAAAVLCLTATAACIFIADENVKKISLGSENAVIVLNSADERLYEEAVNPLPLLEKIKDAAKKAASIAPPPVNNLYWFAENLSAEQEIK
ncbi:MAG: hypothetical protein ACI4IX_03155 [Acutalibacteraceae bacterium]